MTADLNTKVAVLDSEVRTLKEAMADLKRTLDTTNVELHRLGETLAEGKGGWKLAVAFGIPALVGGLIVAAAHRLWP